MAGFVQAIAFDLDGTLTYGGELSPEVLSSIDECRDSGVSTLLVTGRLRAELESDFGDLADHFDAVVYENGAIVTVGRISLEMPSVIDPALIDALRRQDVDFRVGEAIVACHGSDAGVVIDAIASLGLDDQVSHNRTELMILPAGVSKGVGLRRALAELGISPHNTLAVGDAENDLSMLEAAELGIAVGNAVESVKQHADIVLDKADGEAIVDLLRGPLISGATTVHPRRRAVTIGRTADGTLITVPGAEAGVLVNGPTGSGKSHMAGLLVERWIAAGYTALVIDPEGDHSSLDRLHQTIVVDAASAPSNDALLQMLHKDFLSIVLDLSGLDADAANSYLRSVATAVEVSRTLYGLPHWIVIDEAHGSVGDYGSITDLFHPAAGGYCYITYRPDQLSAGVTCTLDVTITTQGTRSPVSDQAPTALYKQTGQPEIQFRVDQRSTPHVRHRLKYVRAPLDQRHRFVFRDAAGQPISTAATLEEFSAAIRAVSTESLTHHIRRGDFSRWSAAALQDRELSMHVTAAENDFIARQATDISRFRERMTRLLHDRYIEASEE